MEICQGDTVLVRMRVADRSPMEGHSVVLGHDWLSNNVVLPRASIVSVETRPLQVGDKVQHTQTDERGEILAINANAAWVKHDLGGYSTQIIDRLERA